MNYRFTCHFVHNDMAVSVCKPSVLVPMESMNLLAEKRNRCSLLQSFIIVFVECSATKERMVSRERYIQGLRVKLASDRWNSSHEGLGHGTVLIVV